MATFHIGIVYLLIASTIVLGGVFISFWGGGLLLEGWAISWGTGYKYQPRPYMHRAS